VLVASPAFASEATVSQRGIDLGDYGAPGRNIPAIERPEMHALADTLADEPQPGDAKIGGFCHQSLYVEMKNRFRIPRALLGQPPPAGTAHAYRAVP
jgi:hypothetical protein